MDATLDERDIGMADNLTHLVWPRVTVLKADNTKYSSGFGGAVRPQEYLYFKADNPGTVTSEVEQVEKIEAPLEPKVEKEQRHADTPVEEEISEKLEEADSSKSAKSPEADKETKNLAKKTQLKFPPPLAHQRQRRRVLF